MSGAAEPQGGNGWRLLGTRAPRCPFGAHRHAAGLDETDRRLSHSELAVAELLVREGHRVRSVAELPGRGRSADLDVCGQAVEVKAWGPPEARGGRRPTSRSVFNKLSDARDQGATAVLWARGSGLSALDASRGVEDFIAAGRFARLRSVRVVGDGFDLAWGHTGPELRAGSHTGPELHAGSHRGRRPPDPGLDGP